ncbi:MAG: amidohydrolase family protein, partial [Humibacillus sp.]|nr:amidohydrolase family protein [Humibacillus sp.]MDN5775894.1 amidohydrolase family protein [Humibacillus sp.]
MTQWARTAGRLDVSGTAGPAEVIRRVGEHVATLPSERAGSVVIGWGHRSAGWDEAATVASLDEVSGAHPVILVSGDGHSGWLNSAALQLLGAGEHTTALDENDWFPVFSRMSELTTSESLDDLYRVAITDAHARGLVGIVDMEFDAATGTWAHRKGLAPLRVRVSVYPDRLEEVLRDGRRTGRPWEGTDGLVVMGGLKIISDGSLGTRTAYCCEPYP